MAPQNLADNVVNDFKGWNSVSNSVVIPGAAKRRPGIQGHDDSRCSWIPDRRG
jgi:hypothetical protein